MAGSGSRAGQSQPCLRAPAASSCQGSSPDFASPGKKAKTVLAQRRHAGKQARSRCEMFPFSSSLESAAPSACSRTGRKALGSPGAHTAHTKIKVFFGDGIMHVGREKACYFSAFGSFSPPVRLQHV